MNEEHENDINSMERNVSLFYAFLIENVRDNAFGISHEKFRDIVKTLDIKPSVSRKLLEMLKNSVISEINQDIDYFRENTKLDEKYNEITRLINERIEEPNSTIAWRPFGSCSSSLNVYRIKELRKKKEKLEEMVENHKKLQLQKRQKLEMKRNSIINQLKNVDDTKIKLKEFVYLVEQFELQVTV